MNSLMQKVRKNKKGFTLAELLIVIAIIAVLVAIAIPTFNNALTKAHKAVDNANVRAAYAEWMVEKMGEDSYDGGDLVATPDEALTYFTSKYSFSYTGNDHIVIGANGVWTPGEKASSGGGG